MRTTSRTTGTVLSALGLAGLLLTGGLVACSSNAPSGSGESLEADSTLQALLPDDVRDAGKLLIATGNDYPPLEFRNDSGELDGFEIELMQRISELLGIDAEFVEADFDALIPSIQGHKYDAAVYGVLDKAERHDTVSFVDHYNTSTSIVALAEQAASISGIDGLCGLRAGVASGTAQVMDVEEASKRCVEAGKPAIEMQTYTTTQDMFLALTADRTDAALNGTPASVYRVENSGGEFALAGDPYNFYPYGIVIANDREALQEAVRAALEQLIDSGIYGEIAEKWGLSDGAVTEAVINVGK